MSNIWGTVIHLKEFLENKETSVHVQKGIESEPVFSLKRIENILYLIFKGKYGGRRNKWLNF